MAWDNCYITARSWWLRSPNWNNTNNERNVNTSGAGNNNNANNSNGVAVDCGNSQLKVAVRPNRCAHAGSDYQNLAAKTPAFRHGDTAALKEY